MLRWLILLFIGCMMAIQLVAQKSPSSSDLVVLLSELRRTKGDTSKIDIYLKLSDYYAPNDTKRALQQAEMALALAEARKDNKRVLLALERMVAGHYTKNQELKPAVKLMERVWSMDTASLDLPTKAKLVGHEAHIMAHLGADQKSRDAFFRQLGLFQQMKDSLSMAGVHLELGKSFSAKAMDASALSHLELAKGLYSSLHNKDGELQTLMAFADFFAQKGDAQSAVKNSLQAQALAKELHLAGHESNITLQLGKSYQALGDTTKAMDNFSAAFEFSAIENQPKIYVLSSLALGHLFMQKCQDVQAEFFFTEALDAAEKLEDHGITISVYKALYEFYSKTNQVDKSYAFLRKLYALQQTYNDEIQSQQFMANQIRYETARKEEENKQLRAKELENQITIKSQEFTTLWMTALIVLTLLVSVYLFRSVRSKKKNNKLLELEVNKRTEQLKQSNQELVVANIQLESSNEELERFAYIASHDLKSPLRSIISFLNLIERRQKSNPDPQTMEYLRFAIDNAKQMHALIQEVLEYSRITQFQETEDTVIDIRYAIGMAIQNLQEQMETKQAAVIVGEVPDLLAGNAEVLQLFQNFISNGIKYNQQPFPRVYIGSRMQEDGSCVIFIKDNGIGIEPQYQTQIFEMFRRLHSSNEYMGTGIGLALCKKIILNWQGTVWVESELGKGATFFMQLPASLLAPLEKAVNTQSADEGVSFRQIEEDQEASVTV